MESALWLRIKLLLSACLLSACSLDPQPEPPMQDGIGGGGYTMDAGADSPYQGMGGSGGGSAGSAGSSGIPDAALSDVICNGDNCYCNDPDASCDAACEGGDGEAGDDADAADPDADHDAAPEDDGSADGALEPESGP